MSAESGSKPGTKAPLRSSFAADEDMAELISFFVEAMDERVRALRDASNSGDLTQLHRLAHQLKGAAAGYGFAPITETASALDALLKEDPTGQKQAEELVRATDDLIALCSRVSA